ncbi:MAG: MFS transporter [Myxococcota bacterium]|nr:MFS transporter [Myxococcota bacterium]
MSDSAHPTLQVLAQPAMRWFLAARFSLMFGRSLVAATLSYHVFIVSDSYAALGLLGLVEFLPVIPGSLVAGVVADRYDRRRILIVAAAISLLGTATLAYLTREQMDSMPAILTLALLLALVMSFARPANSALLPNLVPRAIFQNAAVVASSTVQLAFISGPIAMGFVVGPGGLAGAYAVAVVFYGLALLFLRALPRVAQPAHPSPISWTAVREGLSFVLRHQPILGAMTLDMLAVIFAGATALLPVYAEEILQVGPQGYGLLRSSIAIGAFSMAIVLMVIRPFQRPGRVLLFAVLVFGLATIVFGLSRSLTLSVIAFIAAGMADQVSVTTRSVILQMSTPDALRGRVNAVNFIFIGASNELGDAESGFLASLTSATFSVVAGGAACLGILAAVSLGMPQLRQYQPGRSDPSSPA